jgi:pimeloyl-ACP methyl ester carboxylesterase
MLLNGLNHIPPPSVAEFDSVFGGYLPQGASLPSSWGLTRYYDFAPNAPPSARRVVLLHGGGTCAIGMAPLAFKLTEAGNHVVIYDLWGHGLSSTPLEPHTPALMHAQLLELLVHLGWSKVHLLGFSMGGSMVTTFTAKHSDVVESLTIVAGLGLLRKSERGWWDALIMDGGWGLEGMSRRKIMSFVNGSNLQVNPDWKEKLLKGEVDTAPILKWERETHKGHVASTVSMFRYTGVYDQHEEYRKLATGDVPVLVVLGEKDHVIEAEYTRSELLKLGWKGEIKVVEGATHELPRSHPQEVAEHAGKMWGSLEKQK